MSIKKRKKVLGAEYLDIMISVYYLAYLLHSKTIISEIFWASMASSHVGGD